jgi:hypothetical protein
MSCHLKTVSGRVPSERGFAAAHGGKALPFRIASLNLFEAAPRIGGVAAEKIRMPAR